MGLELGSQGLAAAAAGTLSKVRIVQQLGSTKDFHWKKSVAGYGLESWLGLTAKDSGRVGKDCENILYLVSCLIESR